MFMFTLLLLATIAGAVDVETCGAGESESGSSVLQLSSGGVERKSVSTEQLQRESQRRESIATGIVDRMLLGLAAMVNEGVSERDAVSLARDFCSEFEVELTGTSLLSFDDDSSEDLFKLRQAKAVPLHDMLCHVRQASGDCESEWKQFVADSLTVFYDVVFVGKSFLQVLGVSSAETKKKTLPDLGGGQTDPVLLELLKQHERGVLTVLVASGEDAESARQLALDAVARLKAMSDEELLEHVDVQNVGLARKFLLSELRTACLPTTTDCTDVLVDVIWAIDHLPREGVGGSLLQAGVRTFVKLVMKAQSIPDVAEETAAERALVVGAYFKERKVQSA